MTTSQRKRAEELWQRGAAFLSPAFAVARVAPLIGEPGAAPYSVDILRVKGTRVTVRYCFPSGAVIYAKVHPMARRLFGILGELWEAGFNDTGALRVPEPVACLEEESAILMREARGAQLSVRLAECPPETVAGDMRAAARWLLALHSARLSCLDRTGPCDRLKILNETEPVASMASTHPECSAALVEFLGYIGELAQASAAEPPLTPTHGAFKPSCLFLDPDTVTAIDLDKVSLSDPAMDVAKFVSKVKYHQFFKAGAGGAPAARLAREFLDEYSRGAAANLANFQYYLALYCLKEFAESLDTPGVDRSALDRAEQLCRTELQGCLRHGAPERSLPRERRPESLMAEATARYSSTVALWGSGFGRDSECRVPEVAAFVPDRSVLLLHAAEGVPLSAVLETGSAAEAVRGSRQAARWLAALHRSPIRVGALERQWSSLNVLRLSAKLVEFCAAFPGYLGALLETVRQLKHCLERLPPAKSLVQTHGSFCPKHVFVADGATTAIGLDGSRPADPAKDVAGFVAALRSAAYDSRYDHHTARQAEDAFLEEYLSQAPELKSRIACYCAFYLTLRLLETQHEWPERFELYREAIAEFAASAGLPFSVPT